MVQVKLKEAAREKGLSLNRLAIATGIHRNEISRYANGHVLPRIDRAIRIATLLGVCPTAIWVLDEAA